MRPAQDYRRALFDSAPVYPDGATWKELGHMAASRMVHEAPAVTLMAKARDTVRNMVRAGELCVIDGCAKVPGINRGMTLYARPAPDQSGSDLYAVCRSWAEFT